MNTRRALTSVVLASLTLGGCASINDPRDPLEPMNRAIYSFNQGVDDVALKPLATGYRNVAPRPVQTGVRNFFSNLDDVVVLVNDVLQLKVQQGASDFLRLAFNSTFGLFGLIDIASEMGLKKHNEDFGQTLGRWGIGTGAYLVLPFFGPSSLRDGLGLTLDGKHVDPAYAIEPTTRRNWIVVTRAITQRADLLDATSTVEAAALDEYEFTRDFYLERRESLVADGKSHNTSQ